MAGDSSISNTLPSSSKVDQDSAPAAPRAQKASRLARESADKPIGPTAPSERRARPDDPHGVLYGRLRTDRPVKRKAQFFGVAFGDVLDQVDQVLEHRKRQIRFLLEKRNSENLGR